MQRLLIVFCLSLLAVISASAQDVSFCASVWYPSADHPGGYDTLMQNVHVIDVVNPFWYTPYPDGTLQATEGAENEEQLKAWREAGVPIVPSIFASIPDIVIDPGLRATHIAAIVELVERMDYDGIDIDYEGFGIPARDAFSEFIEELADALHANGRQLTVAVHPKTDDAGTWEGAASQDWSRIAPAVDVFAIMTYDYGGRNGEPQPIGPTKWTIEVLDYAKTFIDLSKVRMGLHFYGYTWPRGNPPATTINWEGVQRYVKSLKPEVFRDSESMEAYLDFKPAGLPRQVIYFADSTFVRFKLEEVLAAHPELGGVAIWGLGGEDPDNWGVLDELRPSACAISED